MDNRTALDLVGGIQQRRELFERYWDSLSNHRKAEHAVTFVYEIREDF